MNTSLSWVKAYVPELDVTAQEYTDAMTLTGTKVEGFEKLDADLDKIVVGQIEKIEKHPDADKLVICQVNVGTETVQIVTGATNVFEGAKVPVVLDGGRVAGGHEPGQRVAGGIKIKKGKLRGVPSYGMMCSIEELGSTRDMYPEAPENGIYIFHDDVQVGADAVEVLGLHDVVFEYEITSNRVDCYSVVGIAREAAATFNKEFKPPVVTETGNNEDVNDYVKVSVENTNLCSRYCARVVKNIKIGPSPEWMQRRLASVGIRPINNLVDITNYVMEEYGQPMHAYDLDTLAGHQIVVKNAAEGEKFTTLDGQERTMDQDVLMICDGEKAVGIAGIMGGENSMITDDVTTMLFEAACFDGVNIRKSSKRVGLRTDASGKFEKGMEVYHYQGKKKIKLNQSKQLMADERSEVNEAYAGDVIGVFDPGIFSIGDTITTGKKHFAFEGIPTFAPEHFAMIRNKDTMKRKQFVKGVEQIAKEGAIQIFTELGGGMEEIIVGVVGVLQFEVLEHRLKNEYNVEIHKSPLPYQYIRWVKEGTDLKSLNLSSDTRKVQDLKGQPLLLFTNDWGVRWAQDKNKDLELLEFSKN